MTENKEIIHSELKKATVKIFVNSEFKGTGFFITDEGYLLTAYHYIKDYELGIKVETSTGEKLKAEIDDNNSLRKFNIAVLKVEFTPSHCIPIGKISDKVQTSDEILVLNNSAYTDGKISHFLKSHKIQLSTSLESGVVYHCATKRMIGIMLEKQQAISFTPLFAIWEELEQLTDKLAKSWDQRFEKLLPKTNTGKIVQNQRIKILMQHQELLNKKLSIVEQEYFLETRESEKFRLEHIINEIKTDLQKVETEINELES